MTDVANPELTASAGPMAEERTPAGRGKLYGGIAQVAVSGYGLWAFALGSRTAHGAETILGFKLVPNAPGGPSPATVPAEPVALTLAALAVVCGLVRIFAPLGTKALRWLAVGYFVCFVSSFLIWCGAGSGIGINVSGVVELTATGAVPLVLGSLSALMCERSGVVNIAVEGQFLLGAFASTLTATMTGSIWAGLVSGMLGGVLISALLAVFANRYLIEQVVLGIVIDTLAAGLTGFFYDRLMANNPTRYDAPPLFGALRIPGLASIPVIGPLFDQNIIFYAAYVMVPVLWYLLMRTRWGLRTRAVGEHPTAADTVGVKVVGLRYRNVLMAGLLSGLGGVWMTIGSVGPFDKDMSSGRGYVAIAALIVGRWSPYGALGASLLFGFALELNQALSSLQTPIPGVVLQMAPYLTTIFVVAALGGLVRPPAASNKPYVKG
jgi:simple sugar transport system permease protein